MRQLLCFFALGCGRGFASRHVQILYRIAAVAGVIVALSLPRAVLADSATVADERGDIFPGPEISDIVSATVTYDKARITIAVEHSSWNSQWRGKLTFSNGRTYLMMSDPSSRGSLLSTMKQYRGCVAGASPCRTIPCTGWSYSIDRANLRTSVSIPVRCFPKSAGKVKVMPFHQIVDLGASSSVIDPITTTPWIRRG